MKPLYWIFSALSLPLGQATAYLVSPNGTAAPGSAEDCSNWVGYEKDMTCQMVEVLYEITAAEFEEWVINKGLLRCIIVGLTDASLRRTQS